MWVTLIFLLVIGFAYSYYFTAFTQIYFLMRRKVDDVDLDEVYLEEDEPDEPHLPPSPDANGPPGGTTLPMVDAPRPATGEAPARRRNRRFPRVTDAPTDPALHRTVRRCAAGRTRGQGRRWGYGGLELCTWGDHLEVQRALSDAEYGADESVFCAATICRCRSSAPIASAKPFAIRSIAGTKRSCPTTSGATAQPKAVQPARPRN